MYQIHSRFAMMVHNSAGEGWRRCKPQVQCVPLLVNISHGVLFVNDMQAQPFEASDRKALKLTTHQRPVHTGA